MSAQPQQRQTSQGPYVISREPGTPDFRDDAAEEGLDIVQYVSIVRRHKWGILSLALAGLIVAAILAVRAVPIYQGKVTMVVEPKTEGFSLERQYGGSARMWLFYETQYSIIKSRSVAALAVDDLGLVREALKDKAQAAEQPKEPGLVDSLKAVVGLGPGDVENTEPLSEETQREQLRNQLAGSLSGGVTVRGGKKSEIITISYESSDREKAAEYANAIAKAYIEYGLSSRVASDQEDTEFLNTQLSELRENLEDAERALEEFQNTEGMIDTAQNQEMVGAKLSGLSSELVRAQTARSEAEIRYNQAVRLKNAGQDYESLASVLQSPRVQAIRSEVTSAERQVSTLSERYGPKHPKMKAAKADLDEASRALVAAVNKVIQGLRKEYEVALSQERRINRLIAEQKGEIGDLRGKGLQLAKLERDVENSRKLYEAFLSKYKAEDISDEYRVSNARVLDKALVPGAPIKPNKQRMLMIGAVLGLMLGIGFAILREKLDNTFRVSDQLESTLGLPVLGVVPLLRKLDKNSFPERFFDEDNRSTFAEAINHIRTGVLFSDIDSPPKTVLVTSATSGEGKTTLSTNLAIAYAQLGRTLLIEADLRKPRFGEVFPETRNMPGLTDVVSGQTPLKEALNTKTNINNLYVLTGGTRPPNPLEFLSSDRFQQVWKSLREHFDHIIIDAPPVLVVADAQILSRLSDGVILNVRAESTQHKMARDAMRKMVSSHCKIIGTVLAQADTKRMAYYGGQYYKYYASYYSDDAKT